MTPRSEHTLKARRTGINTQQEAVVFMRSDCHVCRAEGLAARSQVALTARGRTIIATLYHVSADWLHHDEAGLSESAWERMGVSEGTLLTPRHPEPNLSLSDVRSRIYGNRLSETQLQGIIGDVVRGKYTDVHLAAFLTTCATWPLDEAETVALTRVMVGAGEQLSWGRSPILDKHSIGGLPGNRTTPIIVSIVAAHGLTMPKTSSRAITSPAGTADAMETLAPVDLDLAQIRRVVEAEGGCIVWGGSVRLSPADDILIRIERALEIDSEGQLIASVLSKKIAAGATHLVLDAPVGPTAKIRTAETARELSRRLTDVGSFFGLETRVIVSDGTQPVGRGIGPSLEARDVLAVLQDTPGAPDDLRTKACALAGALLELGGKAEAGHGSFVAARTLSDGIAWAKFQRICEAQGGMRTPPVAELVHEIVAERDGLVEEIDNRRIAKVAKLAGAPEVKSAGVVLLARANDRVERGQPLYAVHADSPGELEYALDYVRASPEIFRMSP